ncbi:serine/threonine-protein kinase PknK [Rhodococcus sp. OK611]|uniref:serine/threonine-protein kinase n=1 Tax=unclassified Rhodococcus (in: high G+C Gram-positive bacteria) TaxID=192944 RepID=UPI000BC70596|nr:MULTISPECIES: serine/threonine-protein kinase [unclassified Rhodococcus (in: high G+C Gram-positive bacteria)]PTR38963.1 serine/threonine-protein kinase PknK [Rhodococcus sp. OK611]SNX92749.1 serine/threonine-protein kinase PknK [Rhodococcus sp. OK270]
MAETDPLATQRGPAPRIATELRAAGFENAEEIGRGGFGVVYRCLQRSLDRTVAIKVLTSDPDPESLDRFLREERAMGRLSGHPNIVKIYQVGATGSGRPYLVMEYHPHDSLESRIRRSGPLSWGEALHLGIKMAGALETAHRAGALHRDVKPANILLTDYGEPQLTDFGISRLSGGFETTSGDIAGSPAFTAPEVLEGRAPTPASDVYGLGATLFCALTGHAAFERRSGEKLIAQFVRITREPVPVLHGADIPPDVSAAVEKAMARDPTERPATALEMGELFRAVQARHELVVDELPLPADLAAGLPGAETNGGRVASAARHSGIRMVSIDTPPAPATRFRPPTSSRPLVPRTRLIDMLRGGERRRLVAIHAPAGFGKSALAAQWREVLTHEGVTVAWLAVDEDDTNVVWFLAHLIEAVRRVRPTLADELQQTLEQHADRAERYVLSSLIDDFHDTGERLAIVIDDWHRAAGPETVAALTYLLDNACHHLQVIVTSRTQTGLPLSRMRVHDELIEIDATALRFDLDESMSFLTDVGGLALDSDEVSELTRSTDGWAAALQLMSLSLRGAANPAEMIGRLAGRQHVLGEFLAENVLDALEPEILDFLLATCLTERVCGDLAADLADIPRGQAMLETLEERDLFLSRTEDDFWFRYHRLFADHLRRRLERDQPARVRSLHRTASSWFADHGLLGEAVHHGLAAGDIRRAVELVERDGTVLLEHSQMATLLALIDKLPADVVDTRPRLLLAQAWANVLLQRGSAGLSALDRACAALDQCAEPDQAIADLQLEADVVRAVLMVFADQVSGVDELVAPSLSRPDTLRPWVVSVAANVASFLALHRFDFDAARRLQHWAGTYHHRTGGPFSVMYGHCCLGLVSDAQLDLDQAEDSFLTARRLAVEAGGTHSHAARLGGALLGQLLYERGRIEEAERLLDESSELGSGGGVVEFMISQYAIGARIKALRGDRAAAALRLGDGTAAAESLSLPRLLARMDNERVVWDFPVRPGYRPVQRPRRVRSTDGPEAITAQLEDDTAIRLMLASGEPDSIESACGWAEEWVQVLAGGARKRAALQSARLLVACLATAGRTDQAKSILAGAASVCADHGMIRFLPDGGPQLQSVLRALLEDQRAGRWPSGQPPVPSEFLTAAADMMS